MKNIQNKINLFLCVIFFVLLITNSLNAGILFRNTFEEYEGGLSQQGWITAYGGNGGVGRKYESDSAYQTLSHGLKSLQLYSPDPSSYANARHSFADIPKYLIRDVDSMDIPPGYHWEWEEYMVEFYLWIPPNAVTPSNFYIYKPELSGNPADISIILDGFSYTVLPDGYEIHQYNLSILDKNGSHSLVYGLTAKLEVRTGKWEVKKDC